MNCKHCAKPVVLMPSAVDRAARYGGTPADYTRLFPVHAACALRAREADLAALLARGGKA